MPVILFCFSFKGGVGKTSGALAIASCLSSLYSKKVLLVDCDPSTNLTAFFQQSIGKEDAFTNTIKDCLTGDVSPEFAIRRFTYMRVPGEGKERDRYYTNVISPVLEECVENTPSKNVTRTCILDFLPGDSSIGTLTFDDNTVLRSMFEDLDYDIVILDGPPELLRITLPCLFSSDALVIPTAPISDSIQGLSVILNIVDEVRSLGHPLEILGFYLNMVENTSTHQAIASKLREMLKDSGLLFDAQIKRLATPEKSRSYGIPPTVYEFYTSPYNSAYVMLCNEILARLQERGML